MTIYGVNKRKLTPVKTSFSAADEPVLLITYRCFQRQWIPCLNDRYYVIRTTHEVMPYSLQISILWDRCFDINTNLDIDVSWWILRQRENVTRSYRCKWICYWGRAIVNDTVINKLLKFITTIPNDRSWYQSPEYIATSRAKTVEMAQNDLFFDLFLFKQYVVCYK